MSKLYNEIMTLVVRMRARGFVKEAQALEGTAFEYNLALSDMLGFAHPEGDAHVMDAQMGLGDFETLGSAQKKMIEVALKQPGMSRMAKLAGLVKEGQEEESATQIAVARDNLLEVLTLNNFMISYGVDEKIARAIYGDKNYDDLMLLKASAPQKQAIYDQALAEYKKALNEYDPEDNEMRLIENRLQDATTDLKNATTEYGKKNQEMYAFINDRIKTVVEEIRGQINALLSDPMLEDPNGINAANFGLRRIKLNKIPTFEISNAKNAATIALGRLGAVVNKFAWWQQATTAARYDQAAEIFAGLGNEVSKANMVRFAAMVRGGKYDALAGELGVDKSNINTKLYGIDQHSISMLNFARSLNVTAGEKNKTVKLGQAPPVGYVPLPAGNKPTPAATPATRPAARPVGNKPAQDAMGPAIQKMQEALITFLKDGPTRVGEPDGRWGPKTNAALIEAQRSLTSGALQMRAPAGKLPALGVKNITPQQQQQFAAAATANTAAMVAAPKKAKVEYDTVGGVSFNSWNMSGLNYFIRLLQTNMPNLDGIAAEANVKKNLTKNAQSADNRTQTYVRDPHTGKMTQEHLVRRNREKLEESAQQAHDRVAETAAENALIASPPAQSQPADLTYGEVDRVLRTLIQRAERMSADAMNDTGEVPAKLYEYERRAKTLLNLLSSHMKTSNFAGNTPVTARPSDPTASGNKDDGYAKGRGRSRQTGSDYMPGDSSEDQPRRHKWDEKPFGTSAYRPQPLSLLQLAKRAQTWGTRNIDAGLIDYELYSTSPLEFENLSNPDSILNSVLDADILQSLINDANTSLNGKRPNSPEWSAALLRLSAYSYVADYCLAAGKLIYAIREAYTAKPNADDEQSKIANLWLGALNRAYNHAIGLAQKGAGRQEVQPRSSGQQTGQYVPTTGDASRNFDEQQRERRLSDMTRGGPSAKQRPPAGRFGRPGVVPNR